MSIERDRSASDLELIPAHYTQVLNCNGSHEDVHKLGLSRKRQLLMMRPGCSYVFGEQNAN